MFDRIYILENIDYDSMSKEEKADFWVTHLNENINSIFDDRDALKLIEMTKKEVNDLGYELYNDKDTGKYFFDYEFENEKSNFSNADGKKNDEGQTTRPETDTNDEPQKEQNQIEKIIYNEKFVNSYKMIAGTFLPAFVLPTLIMPLISSTNKNRNSIYFGLFIVGLVAGGYYTSKILKDK